MWGRRSTSRTLTVPVRVPGAASWMRVFLAILHQPAPWQLKTPTTPLHLFTFHTFSRLKGGGRQWRINRWPGPMEDEGWVQITHLVPSRAGSVKRQSIVGRPGSCARRTDPSGRTSFLRRSKLWFPGLSL